MLKIFSKIRKNQKHISFEKRICYQFKNIDLFTSALTHCSANDSINMNYERLEFLGDSVLSCIFAEYFFKQEPNSAEGVLAQHKNIITNGRTLSEISIDLGLEDIIITDGDEVFDQSGHIRKAILEDCLEALIGVIFLENGYEKTKKIVLPWFGDIEESVIEIGKTFNPKGRLQEFIQAQKPTPTIEYIVTSENGKSHKKNFTVDLLLDNKKASSGHGNSKKSAEEEAADKYLASLK